MSGGKFVRGLYGPRSFYQSMRYRERYETIRLSFRGLKHGLHCCCAPFNDVEGALQPALLVAMPEVIWGRFMRCFFSLVMALVMLTACAGPIKGQSNPADLAALHDFGFTLGMVERHYIKPIDIRTLVVLALLGIEHQPLPAESAAQPILQSAIADIEAMPAYYTLPTTSADSEDENTGPYGILAEFGDAVTKVSALPGAPDVEQLLQAATVSMVDGIDSTTRYIPRTINRKPAFVQQPATRWCLIGNIFYIHVFSFNTATPLAIQDMYSQAETLSGGKLSGVILDLRSNGGGLLYMTASVAGLFLPNGSPIATIVTRPPQSNETLTATSGDITKGLRLAVLVNKQTSNGAEIVAGALKFNHRAILLGATTAGSGFVRTEIPLPDSGLLLLVTGQIILASGQPLQSQWDRPGHHR